jgi:hypothetical protein
MMLRTTRAAWLVSAGVLIVAACNGVLPVLDKFVGLLSDDLGVILGSFQSQFSRGWDYTFDPLPSGSRLAVTAILAVGIPLSIIGMMMATWVRRVADQSPSTPWAGFCYVAFLLQAANVVFAGFLLAGDLAFDPVSPLEEPSPLAIFLLVDFLCSTLALRSWHSLASRTVKAAMSIRA